MSTPIFLAQAVDKFPLTNSAAKGRAERGAEVDVLYAWKWMLWFMSMELDALGPGIAV